jgi:hypothetical protein
MGWWNRLWGGPVTSIHIESSSSVRLTLPGWSEDTSDGDMRIWRDSDGDVLSLAFLEKGLNVPCGETKLRNWCREMAQHREGGLIEAQAMTWGAVRPSASSTSGCKLSAQATLTRACSSLL